MMGRWKFLDAFQLKVKIKMTCVKSENKNKHTETNNATLARHGPIIPTFLRVGTQVSRKSKRQG